MRCEARKLSSPDWAPNAFPCNPTHLCFLFCCCCCFIGGKEEKRFHNATALPCSCSGAAPPLPSPRRSRNREPSNPTAHTLRANRSTRLCTGNKVRHRARCTPQPTVRRCIHSACDNVRINAGEFRLPRVRVPAGVSCICLSLSPCSHRVERKPASDRLDLNSQHQQLGTWVSRPHPKPQSGGEQHFVHARASNC